MAFTDLHEEIEATFAGFSGHYTEKGLFHRGAEASMHIGEDRSAARRLLKTEYQKAWRARNSEAVKVAAKRDAKRKRAQRAEAARGRAGRWKEARLAAKAALRLRLDAERAVDHRCMNGAGKGR